jgi:hypothetical protein
MKIIAVIFFTMLLISVKGQQHFEKKIYIGVGINSGVPVGIANSAYSFTFGGNIKAELSTSQKFLITLSAGYYQFLRKGGGEGVAFLPVLGGFKYHFEPKVFITAQAGIGIPTLQNVGTVFCFVPGIGYNITKKLEVTGNFTGFGQYGYVIGSMGIELTYYF